MNTRSEEIHDAATAGLAIVGVLVVFALLLWIFLAKPVTQYEVTLGDGSKATCIVTSVRGGGGMACIQHTPTGK